MAKMRSLEEIEAAHRKRAEQKGMLPQEQPEDDPETDFPEGNDDNFQDPPERDDVDDGRYNELTARIAQLQNELDATKGRVIPEQRRSASLESTLQQLNAQMERERSEWQAAREEYDRRIEELTNKDFRVEDVLTEEERDSFDPETLAAMAKIAQAVARRAVPKTNVEGTVRDYMQQERTRELESYKQDQLSNPKRTVSRLQTIMDSTQFQGWLENNRDVQYTAQALQAARTKREVDDALKVLDKRLNDYLEESKGGTRNRQTTDVNTSSLGNHMRRTRSEGANEKQLAELNAELKNLSRSRAGRSSPRAKEILAKIQQFG